MCPLRLHILLYIHIREGLFKTSLGTQLYLYIDFFLEKLNGHSVNGTHEPATEMNSADNEPAAAIKCLDDPNFNFDESSAVNNTNNSSVANDVKKQHIEEKNTVAPTPAVTQAPATTTATIQPQQLQSSPAQVQAPSTVVKSEPLAAPAPVTGPSKQQSDNLKNMMIQAENNSSIASASGASAATSLGENVDNKSPKKMAPVSPLVNLPSASGIPVAPGSSVSAASGSSSSSHTAPPSDLPVSAPPAVKKPSYRLFL